jgi:drug/metabolite transporter (DMT)-like permease
VERVPAARRIDVILLLVAIVWGSSYLAAKTAASATPVLVVLFARYAISAVACLALLAVWRGPARISRAEFKVGGLLGLTQAAVLVVETYGVAHTSAANAALIISLTIVLTPLLDRTGANGRLPGAFFAAAGVCVIGVGLLMSGGGLHAPRLGDLLMLGAAGIRAVHVALVGRLTAGRALRPMQLTTVQTLVGTVLFLVPAGGSISTLGDAGAGTWAQLVYLALFCSVFAFLAQTWAVQRTSASRATLLLGTEPVWAVVVGASVGGEALTAVTGLGAATVVAGTYWGQAIERRHRAGPKAPADPSDSVGVAAMSSGPGAGLLDGEPPARSRRAVRTAGDPGPRERQGEPA